MTTLTIIGLVIVGIIVLAIIVGKRLDRDCPHCEGTGDLPPNGYEDHCIPCPVCQGRGYLL